MSFHFRLVAPALALAMLTACTTQTTPAPAPVPVTDENPPPLVGGFSPVAQDDPNVINAAQFALGTQGGSLTLRRILKAEQQVVNGMNYRLCLKVQDGDSEKTAEAQVYRSRQQEFTLSSWQWQACP